MDQQQYNLRVYALICTHSKHILTTKENYKNLQFKKFPGGGLQPKEGLLDCLQRELYEELQFVLPNTEPYLFFANPWYQESAFNKEEQLFSFYYLIEIENQFNCNPLVENREKGEYRIEFEWTHLSKTLDEFDLFFPVDLAVLKKIKQHYNMP